MQTRYTSADQWAEAKDGVIPAPYALEEGEQIILCRYRCHQR